MAEDLPLDNVQSLKQVYYARRAEDFDRSHIAAGDEHYVSLTYISGFVAMLGIESVLDVGAGTGRGLAYLRANHPGVRAHGIEPSPDMRAKALEKGIGEADITLGRAESMPFADRSFDATTEFGVVHHIERPERAVREMMRVSRKAVFLSEGNRFGQGGWVSRWVKLVTYKLGMWPAMNWVKTRGKGYRFEEADGLVFSYSPYDQFGELAEWADRIVILPTGPERGGRSWMHPLLTSSQVLLCAFKDDRLVTKGRA